MKDLAVIRLLQQANDAEARYAQTADQSDLEAALTAWAGAPGGMPATASASFRAAVLSNLGTGHLRRSWRTGLVGLDAAIGCFTAALREAPADAPDRASYLDRLGSALRARHRQSGPQGPFSRWRLTNLADGPTSGLDVDWTALV